MESTFSLRDLSSKILHLKLNQNYNVEVAEWEKNLGQKNEFPPDHSTYLSLE